MRTSIAVTFSALTLLVSAGVVAGAERGEDHESDARQDGTSESGDANVGQITAVTSDGDTSLDAANHSRDASVRTGDADGSNELESQVWTTGFGDAHIDNEPGELANDDDDDDAKDEWRFNSFVASGDGVAGQIMGVVTAAGGVTDVVVANTSDDVDLETGDAEGFQDAFTETGDALGGQAGAITSAGVTTLDATNLTHDADVETGDGFSTYADAFTGDGIAGQLFGVVTASTGSADVALANTSDHVDVDTGDADAFYDSFAESGDGIAGQVAGINAGGVTSVDATNASTHGEIDTGDAEAIEDDSVSISGDGVGGQVFGVVTAPGGRADLVLSNTSALFELLTGETFTESFELRFIGRPDVFDD